MPRVTSFKVPTTEEASHDFLWRIHKATPGIGMIGVFNRSQYEDVLVVRVEGLAPKEEWKRRYDAINAFERNLAESRVRIVKCFLHISKERQRERLLNRLEDPTDQWKFKVSDLATRTKWDEYMAAYEDAVNRCNTP
jgi:polyphosphate kinase 2 (PPK2 family)